jgi:hypothetical protein
VPQRKIEASATSNRLRKLPKLSEVGLYEYTADKVLQKLKALNVLGWEGGQVGVTVLCGLTIRESYFFIVHFYLSRQLL